MKILLVILLFINQSLSAQKRSLQLNDLLQPAVFDLTMVMVHDVVNPPAASRYYAYCLLGAYDIVAQNNDAITSPAAIFKNYSAAVIHSEKYDYRLAALFCILETGKSMLPSGDMLADKEDRFIQTLKKRKFQAAVIEQAIEVARSVTRHIIEYSKTDHYNQLSAQLRYTPLKGDQFWYPTPPSYLEAVEPHWNSIRPMMIDSCTEFKPAAPVIFSKDSTSEFYKLAKEVYEISLKPAREQLAIASFWDCNPFAITSSGHMMIGFKKISPGAHWMNIAALADQKANLDLDHSIQLQAILSGAIVDAFICCWDEKFRSNRIRPETYINRYLDVRWQPFLQTPPFPEYTSGHSVISTTSAEILTYFLGDHFSFTDNTEQLFDIPERTFPSFRQAAQEASISRLYGGIHYRDAIENGQSQGKSIAEKIIEKIKKAGVKSMVLK